MPLSYTAENEKTKLFIGIGIIIRIGLKSISALKNVIGDLCRKGINDTCSWNKDKRKGSK